MKYLMVFLFSFPAFGVCYLRPDLNDPSIIRLEKSSQMHRSAICKVPCSNESGDVFSISIVHVPEGFIGNLLDLIGLGKSRDWTVGDLPAKDERVVCQIDSTKKQAKIDAKAAKDAAEKAKNDKKKSDWETMCSKAKAGIETLLCEERGYL